MIFMMNDKDVKCRVCGEGKVIRKGKRRTKYGCRQLYYCKACGKGFVDCRMRNKTYGPNVIANAISYYNLGNSLEQSAKLVNKRFKVITAKTSVHRWIEEFRSICTYSKLRNRVLMDYIRA